jgi:hypothetical protein
MKLIKNDGSEFEVQIQTRVTGLLKDSVARSLQELKLDPKEQAQAEILSSLQAAIDPKNPEKTKINLADGLKLNLLKALTYSETEYNIVRQNDITMIKVFKVIADISKLSPTDLDLFNTSEVGDFWQSQDINAIREQVEFFRSRAKL